MKNSINKYLYYTGMVMFLSFFGFIYIGGNIFEKTSYSLIIYDNKVSGELPIEGLNDINHRINHFMHGFSELDIPDKRIKVSQKDLYVLIKQKNKNIEFVTDDISELNDYLKDEIK